MTDLFEEASANGIQVEYCPLPENGSLSVQDDEGDFILMDYSLINSHADERIHLAHELGHCIAGGFYSLYASPAIRAKAEWRANRWAIEKLLPKEALYEALNQGLRETWEIAEYLELPQDFVEKALTHYGLY